MKILGTEYYGIAMLNAVQSREYSKDSGTEGILYRIWAVNVNWDSFNGGWNVNANSVENPNRWDDGNQVFSKLSSFNPSAYRRRRCFSAIRRASCRIR